MNRGSKLFGLVVTPTDFHGYGKYVNKVFVLEGTGIPHLFHVCRDAFKLEAENVYYMEGNEFDIVADIKNLSRKREQYLEVGDWISWFHTGGNEIIEFKREHRLHEMRCRHEYQFKIVCVKSPTEGVLYNRTFGFVKLTPADNKRLMPEIAFECWVDIILDDAEEKLTVQFAEFVTSNYQMQIDLLDTPWKEHHQVEYIDEDDAEFYEEQLIVPQRDDKKKQNNVFDRLGYYTSFGSLYDRDHPDKHFLIPYVTDDMQPGVQYRFDAFWNEEAGVFIVTSTFKCMDFDVLSTVPVPGGDRHTFLLVDTVNQRKDFKSLFHTEKHNYGTMDCPTDALALHHLSRYADSKCRVYFYEDRKSSFGRFRIEKVEADKAAKIDKNIREGVKELAGIRCVVVSAEGRLFSAGHPTARIFLPPALLHAYPVGTQLVCAARVDAEKKELEAIEDTVKVLRDEAPLEYFEHNGRLIFATSAVWTPRGDVLTGVVSPVFSLLDDPLGKLPRPHSTASLSIWVAEAGTDAAGHRRVAQAPFFVVAFGRARPELTESKFIDRQQRDIGGWLRARDGTLKPMEVPPKTEVKPGAGNISLPKPRLPRSTASDSQPPATVVAAAPSASSITQKPRLPRSTATDSQPTTAATASSTSTISQLPQKDEQSGPPSCSSGKAPFECGCATGACAAKAALMKLMNDIAFRNLMHKMPEPLLDRVLECIL